MTEEENKINLPEEKPGAKPTTGMRLVGINLGVLVGYTVICAVAGDSGLILDAFIIAIHVIICIGMAAAARRWAWLLSGLIVLIIGFSTCVGVISLRGGIG